MSPATRRLLLIAIAMLAACDGGAPTAASDATGTDGAAENADVAGGDDATGEAATDSATARAIEQLSSTYQQLAEALQQNSSGAVDWAEEDISNLGDWEYRIVDIPALPAAELEAELNKLGQDRWEVYWVESLADGTRVFLKRPAISYISRVPLSTLLRLLPGSGE